MLSCIVVNRRINIFNWNGLHEMFVVKLSSLKNYSLNKYLYIQSVCKGTLIITFRKYVIHFESFVFFELKYLKTWVHLRQNRETFSRASQQGGELTYFNLRGSRGKLKVAIFSTSEHANFMQCPIYLLYSVIVMYIINYHFVNISNTCLKN